MPPVKPASGIAVKTTQGSVWSSVVEESRVPVVTRISLPTGFPVVAEKRWARMSLWLPSYTE